jgi:hypothetical protein
VADTVNNIALRELPPDRRDWRLPILGWFLVNLGGILKLCLPKYVDVIGLFVLVVGGICVFATLQRSMVAAMARLFCIGFAFELGAMMLSYPPMGQSLFPWMVMLALIVGIIGPIASHRARKNAYGLILATIWVLLSGVVFDALFTKEYDDFFAYLLFAAGLGWITHLYSRWVKGREFPHWMTEWYWKLPAETSATSEATDLPAPSKPVDVDGQTQPSVQVERSS